MEHLRIRIHKELGGIRERYMGFTAIQWLSVICCMAVTVPLYVSVSSVIGSEPASWLVILIGAPILLCGFLTIQQLSFMKFVLYMFRQIWFFGKPLSVEDTQKKEKSKKGKEKKAKTKSRSKSRGTKPKRKSKKSRKNTEEEVVPAETIYYDPNDIAPDEYTARFSDGLDEDGWISEPDTAPSEEEIEPEAEDEWIDEDEDLADDDFIDFSYEPRHMTSIYDQDLD